jgi:hypothetical protein
MPLLSLFAYFALYFIVNEFTQIRSAVAIGIFLLSIKDIKDKNLYNYLLKSSVAILFHYSAIIMLPLYFLSASKFSLFRYALLPILAITIGAMTDYMITLLDKYVNLLPGVLGYKMRWYVDLRKSGAYADINIFNHFYIALLVIYYFVLFNIDKLKGDYDILHVKLLGITLAAFYGLHFMPALAFRTSGFLGISIVLLLPSLIGIVKQKQAVFGLILIWLSMNFYVQLQNLNM